MRMTFGQSSISTTNSCSIGDDTKQENKQNIDVVPATIENHISIFNSLISIAGIQNSRIKLVTSNQTSSAKYIKQDTISYIIYNPLAFHNKQDEIFIGVIAHELGHFINHHDDFGSRKDLELDADYYIGFLMRRLNILDMNKVFSCLTLFPDNTMSETHPEKEKRKISIQNGFENSANGASINTYANSNPRVVWEVNKLTINDKEFNCIGVCPWDKDGIFYDSATNSTYQLINFRKEYSGIGRLVNNRTEITFLRTGKNTFKIYRNGKILRKSECEKPYWAENNEDLVVKCYDPILKKRIDFILKDYKYAKYNILLPANSK